MISNQTKEQLKKNWGEKASAMNCYAEVKFIDSLSSWACYIYAMNPRDEDEIICLIYDKDVETCEWSYKELMNTYNKDGEYPEIDQEYRRKRASELFKQLSEGV